MNGYRLYDFTSESGHSTIQGWLDHERITKRDRGQLNQKLDMLAQHGMGLPPKLLAGPLNSKRKKLRQKNIYKLIIHGDKMLRPMLCRGPISNDEEFTLLLGAIESNWELDRDPIEAEAIRELVIAQPTRRRDHERYH